MRVIQLYIVFGLIFSFFSNPACSQVVEGFFFEADAAYSVTRYLKDSSTYNTKSEQGGLCLGGAIGYSFGRLGVDFVFHDNITGGGALFDSGFSFLHYGGRLRIFLPHLFFMAGAGGYTKRFKFFGRTFSESETSVGGNAGLYLTINYRRILYAGIGAEAHYILKSPKEYYALFQLKIGFTLKALINALQGKSSGGGDSK